MKAKIHNLFSFLILILLVVAGIPETAVAGKLDPAKKLVTTIVKGSPHLTELAKQNPALHRRLVAEMSEAGADQFLRTLSFTSRAMLLRHGEAAIPMLRAQPEMGGIWLREFGLDVIPVWQRAGPNTSAWIANHGRNGVRVAGQHGAEVAERLGRSVGTNAFPVVMEMGRPATAILLKNPSRLPMLQAVVKEGQKDQFLRLLARHGEAFLQFVERNWKGIGIAAACTAFVTNPEAFTKPAADVAVGMVGHVVDGTGQAVVGVATKQPYLFLACFAALCGFGLLLLGRFLPVRK